MMKIENPPIQEPEIQDVVRNRQTQQRMQQQLNQSSLKVVEYDGTNFVVTWRGGTYTIAATKVSE